MMNVSDKRHWYDGWIYDRVLAPNQKVPFDKIAFLIPEGSDVIDIGCGTGRLDFRLSEKCRSILAIDLSEKNILTATSTREKTKAGNIEFIHTDLSSVVGGNKRHFDYAVLSYILHEVSRTERIKILTEAAMVANKIIVSDHKPSTIMVSKIIREILEFGAGPDHYRNFTTYIIDGGIEPLAGKCGLKPIHNEIHNSHLQITVLAKLTNQEKNSR